jgi:hypothetical protein
MNGSELYPELQPPGMGDGPQRPSALGLLCTPETCPPGLAHRGDRRAEDRIPAFKSRRSFQLKPAQWPRRRRAVETGQHHGYPPLIWEIGLAVGLSRSDVFHQLATLQAKCYLCRGAGRHRTVEVLRPGHPAVRPEADVNMPMNITSRKAAYVPVVSRIAAGGPILGEHAIEDIFPLPHQLVGGEGPVSAQGHGRLDDQRRNRRRRLDRRQPAVGSRERSNRRGDDQRRGRSQDLQADSAVCERMPGGCANGFSRIWDQSRTA